MKKQTGKEIFCFERKFPMKRMEKTDGRTFRNPERFSGSSRKKKGEDNPDQSSNSVFVLIPVFLLENPRFSSILFYRLLRRT